MTTPVLDLQPGDQIQRRGVWLTLAARPTPQPIGDRLDLRFISGATSSVHWLAVVPARSPGAAMDAQPHPKAAGHMSLDLAAQMTFVDSPPEERVAASRFVLRKARSRSDLRLLLDALGLNATRKEGS